MSTIVIRSRKGEGHGGFVLSDDARRRAREHLKSVGIQVERLQPLIWPEDAVSAYRAHMYAPWQFTTKSDILQGKLKRMKHNLWWKREYGVVQQRFLYVWVFWCPGVGGFAFRGWWTYLVGLKGTCHGGGFKGQVCGKLLNQIMELFPVESSQPLLPIDEGEWMVKFARQYQRGCWCGKPQGKAPIRVEMQGENVMRILGRAEWPKQNKL